MARNRQRAKERKEQEKLRRENAPGPWEHGGEVDQFEAGLVSGAEGQPLDPVTGEPLPEEGAGEAADGGAGGAGELAPGRVAPPERQEGSRVVNFLKACWAELQRVRWPDRAQVGQGTLVVLGFVVLAGAFLGAADVVAKRIVDIIL